MFFSLSINVLSVLIIAFLAYLLIKAHREANSLKEKIQNLQETVSENHKELSLTNEQMKIEISERKKRVDEYMQIKNELSDRNQSRLNFIRNVGHEIRTPLNAINGMLTLLLETQVSTEQQEYLDIARYHSKEMLTLLNDINDFSDISRGEVLDIARLTFSLDETLKSLYNHLIQKTEKKNIKFHYIIDQNVPAYLCGDPIKLRKILFNLTDNAIKFTNDGEVSIQVHMIMEADSRVTLEFQIKDTGIGIPKKVENLLFQAIFCQADESMKRAHEGLGLGLAITKEFVQLLGGKTSFKSREGKGTTFTFTAVFEKCPQECIDSIFDSDLENPHYQSFSFSNFKLLLIETHQIRIKIITNTLTQIGCKLDVTNTLAETLEKCAQNEYQAILVPFTKKHMPDDDWIAAYINSSLASIPIIALIRQRPCQNIRKKYQQLPITKWLEIPINERDLIDCIETICRTSSEISLESNQKEVSLDDIIDKKAALAQFGDETLFEEILSVFIDDLPAQIREMNQSLNDNNFDNLSMHALSLKSSAATIMAGEIKQIAFDLGVAGNDQDTEKTQQLLDRLTYAAEQLKHAYYRCYQTE